MLNIRAVPPSGVGYYLPEDGPGVGEDPGRWLGAAAWRLGLRGAAEADEVRALLAGRDPWTDRPLTGARGERAAVALDLVFTTPKALSILAGFAPEELAGAVESAHREAVDDAVHVLESGAVGVRRSRAGTVQYLPARAAAVSFTHRTSRALDPHLHSHVLVATVAQGVDGLWSALDSRRLFAQGRAAGAAYEARLSQEVGRRLGATLGPVGQGLSGFPEGLEQLFSRRSTAVAEEAWRRSAVDRRHLFKALRPEKERTGTWSELTASWRERAELLDVRSIDLLQVVGSATERTTTLRVDRSLAPREAALHQGRDGVVLTTPARERRARELGRDR